MGSLDFKNNKILKPITIATLLYSALMFIKYVGKFSVFFREHQNPLIPKYLNDYVAFASYFIVPFFGIIICLCIHTLKTKNYNFRNVYFLFGIAFLFFLFQSRIHEFIMSFNPYTS